MAIQNKRSALVCAGLALFNVLVATVAQAQDVSFEAPRNFAVGSSPESVAVGDFDGDGVPDLAVANYASNNVSIHLGNGNGTFEMARVIPALGPVGLVVSDFNGDGALDLVV